MLCVTMIGLESCKLGSLHVVCVVTLGLEVWKFESFHVVCDDDNKFGSLKIWKFTHCV